MTPHSLPTLWSVKSISAGMPIKSRSEQYCSAANAAKYRIGLIDGPVHPGNASGTSLCFPRAQPRSPDLGEQRKRAKPGRRTLQKAALAIREQSQRRDRQTGQQRRQRRQRSFEPAQHAAIFVPDQRLGQHLLGDKSEIVVGCGDAPPALRILLADPVGVAPNQLLRMLRLKQQRLAFLLLRIASEDQIDRRSLVRYRIGPAFQARRPERRCPIRVTARHVHLRRLN